MATSTLALRLLKLGLQSNVDGRTVHDTLIDMAPLSETRADRKDLLRTCVALARETLRREATSDAVLALPGYTRYT